MVKTSTLAVILAALIISVVFTAEADGAGLVKRAISTAGRWQPSDLPTPTVLSNTTNTYTAGQKQIFQSSASTAAIKIVTTSDPSSVVQGDIWFSVSDLKWRGSSATQTAERTENKGIASGYTPLNSISLIPSRFLGSGTNSSSNFLRGDNTWATVSSGYTKITTFDGATAKILAFNDTLSNTQASFKSLTQVIGNTTITNGTTTLTFNLGTNVLMTGGSSQTVSKDLTLNGANTIKHSNTGTIIRNPLGTFATTIAGGAVTANRTINTPVVTGTDTMATLGLAQTYTAQQTFGTATTVGKLVVAGATSGTTVINATAIAGTGFVTLPTSGTLFSGAISTTNQTQASAPTTDKLVFTIPMKVSTPNLIYGIMYVKSSVAGTAVNMAFNLTAGVTAGNKGTCHTVAELTATSDSVANLKLPVVLTGRAISSANTDFITANTPQGIEWRCVVQMGTTASNLKVWINPEVTGATISADINSWYNLVPPT